MRRALALSMTATLAAATGVALALDGQPAMHDPSTVVVHERRYYSYGTGTGLPKSGSGTRVWRVLKF